MTTLDEAGLPALARKIPSLPRLCLLMIAAGAMGAYGWFRLGQGRLHSFAYVCAWLSAFSVMIALLGLTTWLQTRRPMRSHRLARSSGLLFALSIFTALYLLAQGTCGWLTSRQEARTVREGTHSVGASYQSSRILGHMPRRNVSAGARLMVDGEEIFSYTYHTDNFRRRITPDGESVTSRHHALIFFGDSYTFGEGVNDDETLPNCVAKEAPNWAVYNYAFSGYGPNHMLARLESLDTRSEVPESEVTGIYVFIPNHVRRVIGAFSVISWSRHSPWYILGDDGLPRRLGSFQGERAGLTGWYDFLKGDYVIQYLGIDLPPRLTEGHHALTAAVIERSAAAFEESFQGGRFYVVLYPATPDDEFPASEMGERLRARGLQVLDYTQLLPEPAERHFFLPFDSHPRPEAHALVAAQLARDLGLSSAAQTP